MTPSGPIAGPPPKPKTERGFSKPVTWLFGRELIASLKWVALYSAYKGKLDSRDWMVANQLDFSGEASGGEFWFDYTGDTGDGQRAMYSVAYLCLSDLWIESAGGQLKPGQPVRLRPAPGDSPRLPRGSALIIGGDVAYHIADYATLARRFQNPFSWAFEDFVASSGPDAGVKRRALLALPGNHDYYDVIDGFNRQFRRPLTAEGQPNRDGLLPQLSIPGFKRVQEASYFALRLPFGWWFLALDCENDTLDIRQQEYFNKILAPDPPAAPPTKVILATPEPTTVHGRRALRSDKISSALRRLRIDLPAVEGAGSLDPSRCRLDLSGDTHHYERYWGPDTGGFGPQASASNYASVVAGLGGAFLHPSQTDVKQEKRQVVYPTEAVSRRVIAQELFKPWVILTGGFVWLWGSLLAAVVYLGYLASDTRDLLTRGSLRGLLPSLAILASLIVAGGLGAASVLVSRGLARAARKKEVKSSQYWPVWVLLAAATGIVVWAVWRFGEAQGRTLAFDLLFLAFVGGAILALIVFGALIGADLHRIGGRIGFGALGLWHAVLQVEVTFILVRSERVDVFAAAVLLVVLFSLVGQRIGSGDAPWLLLLLYVLFGMSVLALPWWLPDLGIGTFSSFPDPIKVAIAATIGAVMSCVWFGWYLAVALAFNGHTYEAGGAARLETFRGFIRFRLTDRTLTGYVIGIDTPGINGQQLQAHLVDVFELKCEPAA